MSLEQIAANRCFEGVQQRFSHESHSLGCDMHFSIYLPPAACLLYTSDAADD